MSTQSSERRSIPTTRTSPLYLARGQSNYAALKDATCRMWRVLSLTRVAGSSRRNSQSDASEIREAAIEERGAAQVLLEVVEMSVVS